MASDMTFVPFGYTIEGFELGWHLQPSPPMYWVISTEYTGDDMEIPPFRFYYRFDDDPQASRPRMERALTDDLRSLLRDVPPENTVLERATLV